MKNFLEKVRQFSTTVWAEMSALAFGLMTGSAIVFADDAKGALGYDISTGTASGSSTDIAGAGKTMQGQAKQIYYVVVGIALIIVLGFFVAKAVKLAKSGDNPQQRQAAIEGLIHAMIAIALIGGASVISGWAIGVFKSAG